MKVLDLRCANGHGFEGWFASADDYAQQNARGLVQCPLCGDPSITRMPSAPRLNLSGARASTASPPAVAQAREAREAGGGPGAAAAAPAPVPAAAPGSAAAAAAMLPVEVQAQFLRAVREIVTKTEDVGARFPEEARRIHHGEAPNRGIRGQATPEEREALRDEGIETFQLPVPRGLDGPLQ